jgi:hypothetical protein
MLGVIQEQRREFKVGRRLSAGGLPFAKRRACTVPWAARLLSRGERNSSGGNSRATRRYRFRVRIIHFALGNKDLAFRWRSQACSDRSFDLTCIRVDPRFDPLRGDDRFKVLMRQIGVG